MEAECIEDVGDSSFEEDFLSNESGGDSPAYNFETSLSKEKEKDEQVEDVMLEEIEEEETTGKFDFIATNSDGKSIECQDLSGHTLIQRETNGKESFFCLQCRVEFDSFEEFTCLHIKHESPIADAEPKNWEEMYDHVESAAPPLPPKVKIFDKSKYILKMKKVVNTGLEKCDLDENVDEYLQEHQEEDVDQYLFRKILLKEELSAGDVPDKYYCTSCELLFHDIESAEDHDCDGPKPEDTPKPAPQELDPRERNRCPTCKRIFQTLSAMKSHIRIHLRPEVVKETIRKPATCEICQTIFTSEKNLKLHMSIHKKVVNRTLEQALPPGTADVYNELNKFFCQICNKSFNENLLAVHRNMHQKMKEFTCKLCNRQFDTSTEFEIHMQVHTDRKTTEVNDRRPRRMPRPGTQLAFQCQYCSRRFARPHEKVKHERVHTGEKPYNCEVCGKSFRVMYSLTLHLRTHTNIRPYECPTCKKTFKSHPNYSHHLRIHLDERPYQCDLCPKMFRTSVQLSGHRNSHLKPFNCPECSRPFSSLYAVKAHMKTHSAEAKNESATRMSCEICGAEYSRFFALRHHMRDVHDVQILESIPPSAATKRKSGRSQEKFLVTNAMPPVDDDEAVLIAAAAEAEYDAEIYYSTIVEEEIDEIIVEAVPQTVELCFNEAAIMTQVITENDEIVEDVGYQAEETVATWLES